MTHRRSSSAKPRHGRPRRRSSRRLSLESLEPRQVLAANALITEFMASNGSSLVDGDGKDSDWIEIYNPTSQAINLAGWHLTDEATNLDKWTFPAIPQSVLDPGEFLIVFASGQLVETYVDPAGYMHTDFSLERRRRVSGAHRSERCDRPRICAAVSRAAPRRLVRRDREYHDARRSSGQRPARGRFVPTTGALDAPSAERAAGLDAAGLQRRGMARRRRRVPASGYDSGDDPAAEHSQRHAAARRTDRRRLHRSR